MIHTTVRRAVRTLAATSAVALLSLGAAGCGGLLGGGDEKPQPGSEQKQEQNEQPADKKADEGTSKESSSEKSEKDATDKESEGTGGSDKDTGGSDSASGSGKTPSAAGDVTEKDLTAAKERVVEFIKATAKVDGTKACSMVMDPTTKKPFTGKNLTSCAKGF